LFKQGTLAISPLIQSATILLFSLLISFSCHAQGSVNPLQPVDTSSPRNTLKSFLTLIEVVEHDALAYYANQSPLTESMFQRSAAKLTQLLDLSMVPPAAKLDVAADAIGFLVDTLKRLELPKVEQIPGREAATAKIPIARWQLPGTEIAIVRIATGSRSGQYLFASSTVARAGEFYDLIHAFPIKRQSRVASWRAIQLQHHGWMIPHEFVERIPASMKSSLFGTAIWKIVASLGVILVAVLLLLLWRVLTTAHIEGHGIGPSLRRLSLLTGAIAILYTVNYLIGRQVNPTGQFAQIVEYGTTGLVYLTVAWAFWLAVNFIVELVILSPSIAQRSLDANLLRLASRVLGIVGGLLVVAYGAQQLGLPALGLLAGFGVGGLAVALAAQSSIENLIGGLNLYADRPLRLGDYCQFGDMFGTVEHIGLRSTRIRGVDRTLTSIPNADLAKMKITNYANRDSMLFRHTLDLRYETSSDQLQYFVSAAYQFLISHDRVIDGQIPTRVRVLGFGSSSIMIEVFAYVDTKTFAEFYELQESLLLYLMHLVEEVGSGFAFPSQTTYLAQDTGIDKSRQAKIESELDMLQRGAQRIGD
jgi:MscS family membrane protein